MIEWWWFENSRACLYYFLESFFDCQSVPSLPGVFAWWVLGWLNRGGVFRADFFSLLRSRVNFLFGSLFLDSFALFFVEGSILAQDERWRRA